MKTIKTLIGVIATMAGTQAFLFWLGAIDRPLWFISGTALYAVGLWCFAGSTEKEEAR